MTHEGRMLRGKYNSDNNINLNNADTLYYLDNKDAPDGLNEQIGVSEDYPEENINLPPEERKPKVKKKKKGVSEK
jgi:hypothetical protein